MPDFPHLTLKQKLDGRYQFAGRRIEKIIDPQTEANLIDRISHGNRIMNAASQVVSEYNDFLKEREVQGLQPIFDENIIPIFLQVDPKDFDIESLKGFGIEIVSEEDDGFIIGANVDNFQSLASKVDKFIREDGLSKDQAAKLWQIVRGTQWRADYILSPELKEKYIAGISDESQFTVDISIACYLKLPDRPVKTEAETDENYLAARTRHDEKYRFAINKREFREQRIEETDEHFEGRLNRWRKNLQQAQIQRDEIALQRQDYLQNFVENIYGGKILDSFIDLEDSFGFKASMSGQALKDLINGYPFVFEIIESEQVNEEEPVSEITDLGNIEIISPSDESPTICVVDSGIQEEHILLAPAILRQYSKNYVSYENTTADLAPEGGHGTKVAGGILFGNEIVPSGVYQPPCFLINARVLDKDNFLPGDIYPPGLMQQIVEDFDGIRIFNMSIASRGPCRIRHMSTWAATIDKLIHERGIIFLLAAGNIRMQTFRSDKPGISEHLQAGHTYPDYLLASSSRISNPSQSVLGLTVGSVCTAEFEDADRISFGKRSFVSSFSRSGPGLWGTIKPDVVEYGGDFLREKKGFLVTQADNVSAVVVKTGANGIGFAVGTSFATPKVAHIIALLAKAFPTESTLLYKALIIQSARLPEHVFHTPQAASLRMLGYGIPDSRRALENTAYRITFVGEDSVAAKQANLYSVTIPEEIRRAGDDYDILIEVTLTYTAIPRRTRKKIKSYFSSWLSWESSRLGESFDVFAARVLKDLEEPEQEDLIDNRSIRWTISSSPNWGQIPEFKRQDSATQKDWTILKSNTLPAELSFAVVGHVGWDKDTANEIPFALVISFEAISKENEIYQMISIANSVEIEQPVTIPVNQ